MMRKLFLAVFLIDSLLNTSANAMENTAEDFAEKLHKAEGFGLPHTIAVQFNYSEEMLYLKEFIKEREPQFVTLNNMGSNINDIVAKNRYGQIWPYWDLFKEKCGDFILDIGCGTGHTTDNLLNRATIVFNDICNEHLMLVYSLNHQTPGKGFYLNNKRIPVDVDFPSKSFTGIVCSYVGHRLSPQDLESSFNKMANWLKPGGVIFYRVLTVYSKPFDFYASSYEEKIQSGEIWPGYIKDTTLVKKAIQGMPTMVHPHGLKEVSYLAQLNGLEIIEHCVTDYKEKKTPPGTFIAILQKPSEIH